MYGNFLADGSYNYLRVVNSFSGEDYTMSIAFSELISFALGMIASWAFVYWQLMVQPKIVTSDKVAYRQDENRLEIAIFNRSWRQAHDIDVQILVAETYPQGTRTERRTIHRAQITWERPLVALNPRRNWPPDPWDLPVAAHVRVLQADHILKLLKQNSSERRLLFIFSAVDSLSGAKLVRRRTYSLEDIQSGYFEITKDDLHLVEN